MCIFETLPVNNINVCNVYFTIVIMDRRNTILSYGNLLTRTCLCRLILLHFYRHNNLLLPMLKAPKLYASTRVSDTAFPDTVYVLVSRHILYASGAYLVSALSITAWNV